MSRPWYGHFDSAPNDKRQLRAKEWAEYISSFITNGVRNGGTNLQVTAHQSMMVKVDLGMANINGYIFMLKEDALTGRYYNVLLPTAHPQYPRIDRLVLRLNTSQETRTIEAVILMGVAAASPVPPPLLREGYIYELSLAQIRVNAGTLAITAANITDERLDTFLCGLINSILGLDPSMWQAQFDQFIEGLYLDGDNLLAEFRDRMEQGMTANQAAWDAWRTANQNTWDAWFATIKIDPQRYIQFNFDNLAALPGVTILPISRTGDIMTETMVITGNQVPVAQIITDLSKQQTDRILIETETLFDNDGVVPLRTTTMTTSLIDGSVTTT